MTSELMDTKSLIGDIKVYEEQVIVTLLNNPDLMGQVPDLTDEQFAHAETRAMFRALVGITLDGHTPDVVSLAERLEGESFDNPLGLVVGLSDRVVTVPSNLQRYAGIVSDAARRRKEIHASWIYSEQVKKGDASALTNLLASVEDTTPASYYISMRDSLREAIDHADALSTGKIEPGIPTGVRRLDDVTGGFHVSDLIVMAGRPAMGKTAVMMNMILHAAMVSGVPSMVFSAEQGALQLTQRNIAMTGRVDLTKFRTGQFSDDDWPRITSAITRLNDLPVHYYAPPTLTLDDLCRQAIQAKQRYNIGLIAVDYIQILDVPAGENRNLAVGAITRRLKGLAKQLDICVLALSQLNRECEKRNNKRPIMADLKESGSIEQDADSIWGLYREGVYNELIEDKVLEVINLKNRHGPTGTAYAGWLPQFVSLDEFRGKNYE